MIDWACEDHGPVGTPSMDTYPTEVLAERVAERLGGIVLPAIDYVYLPRHTHDRPGSIPMRHEIEAAGRVYSRAGADCSPGCGSVSKWGIRYVDQPGVRKAHVAGEV